MNGEPSRAPGGNGPGRPLCTGAAVGLCTVVIVALAIPQSPLFGQRQTISKSPLIARRQAISSHPDSARLITSDIARFWRLFDKVRPESASLANSGPQFQHIDIDGGTVGVQDFVPDRIVSGDHSAARVSARWRYYGAIRSNTLAIDTAGSIKTAIRKSFRKLKALCSNTVFPDVYFVIGALTSAGTVSEHGLLIGAEMNARDHSTPIDQLNGWSEPIRDAFSDLPGTVAHELIHVQQPILSRTPTLLTTALQEGAADFVAEVISGIRLNQPAHSYGDAHEEELWQAFSQALDSTNIGDWFYQGDRATGDRPADLGYYEGYKIVEAYFRRSNDKADAVCEITHIDDAHTFLRQSGYNGPAQ